jgi:thioredoxin reductase
MKASYRKMLLAPKRFLLLTKNDAKSTLLHVDIRQYDVIITSSHSTWCWCTISKPESVRWQNNQTGQTEEHKIRHVFVMTGAAPNTAWLDGCVALDTKGFIKTGADLSQENLSDSCWPLARQPHLLETSLPGVFAVGDARGGSIKRVASAVGEGSTAISLVHKVIQE